MMASYDEEALESLIHAAGMVEVADFLRNKKLYLPYWRAGTVLEIRMELSPDGLGLLAKVAPGIIDNPDLFSKLNINEDGRVPCGVGAVVKDSKIHLIGGEHPNDKTCMAKQYCELQSLSQLVYEFSITDGRPALIPCSSIPQLPRGIPAPNTMTHLGETYVLYGRGPRVNCRCPDVETSKSDLENCFLVLREDGWKYLPRPPFYADLGWRGINFHSAVGSKLYVLVARKLYCYDIKKEEWEYIGYNRDSRFPQGSITLSLSGLVTEEAEGQSTYVVVYNRYGKENHAVHASLVDGDGNELRHQIIHFPTGLYDGVETFKLIELMSESDKGSSTFALVFYRHPLMIALTVFRVSLLFFDKNVEHVAKQQKLSKEDEVPVNRQKLPIKDGFLKCEVLINQRYRIENEHELFNLSVCRAFFY